MLARVVAVTYVYNNTVDEPYHIGSAMVLWETKQLVVGAQHPPLARWVIGLPLVLQGMSFPEARGEYVVVEYPGFAIGQELLFSGKLPYWYMLTAARHSLLIFACLSLFYVYRLGEYLANPLVAMLATIFFSVDPTFLAHSALVGTDIAGCAGFLAGFYYLLRFVAKPQAARAAVAGVVVGLAIACKFSCLLLIPVMVLIVIARRIACKKSLPRPGVLTLACAIAFIILWATYGFAINPMRQQAMMTNEPAWTSLPKWLVEQPIPMPSFFLGQIFLTARVARGDLSYLNGVISREGSLLYFPEALVVKEPLGFLIALIAGVMILIFYKSLSVSRFTKGTGKRIRERDLFLLIPIVLYFAISMHSRYQLGIRHLLPILPLMYLFAVMQFARIGRMLPLVGLIALATIETAAMHPDYLAFFNMLSGGPRKGEYYLVDSNLDWGQDLYRLSQWLKSSEARGRPYTIWCAYATTPLIKELGLDPASLKWSPHGLLAVSKNVEHGLNTTIEGIPLGEDYSWLSRYPIVKRIGYSIDVYDLDTKDANPK